MKRRPLIITACIAGVCFVGICFTLFTKSYIASQSAYLAKKSVSDRVNSIMENQKPEETDSLSEIPEEVNSSIEQPEMAACDEYDITAAEAELRDAQVEAFVAEIDEYKTKMENKEKEEELIQYLEKLAGLEEQIDFSWKALESTTGSISVQQEQAVADLSYKIWDDELNSIYKMLREKISEDDFEILKKEERLWLKQRDEAAESAAIGVSNASVQKLRYTMSLSETTKERTYELVEMYFKEE